MSKDWLKETLKETKKLLDSLPEDRKKALDNQLKFIEELNREEV